MAKPLSDRIATARTCDRVSTTDLEALIVEATAERDRLAGTSASYAAQSVDFALTDDDRDEAARLGDRYARTAMALDAEITALTAKLQARRENDAAKAEQAVKDAIIARRDDLAARFAKRFPKLMDEMAGLLDEVVASDAEMSRAGLRLESAEAIARGVPGTFYVGVVPIARYTQIKLPSWDSGHNFWPRHVPHIMEMSVANMEANRKRMRQEEERENARWSRYSVEAPTNGTRTFIETRQGMRPMDRQVVEAVMTVDGVKDAETNGCTVTPLAPNETVGAPPAMMAL